jgi:cell division protein ZapA
MEQIEVRILDRDFRLAVSADEKPRVLEAVRLVDERMRAVRDAGKVSGIDRIAVMAALQLAHQLIGSPETGLGPVSRVREMSRRLDETLAALPEPGDGQPGDAADPTPGDAAAEQRAGSPIA